ncbi:MAG: bifunctional folylpolyglutamate synthase/dihydrofolate synthase [Bacteroidia bacterium]
MKPPLLQGGFFMDYKHTLEYLYNQLPMFHRIGPAAYKANLDNTHAISNYLNHPEKAFKSIHIAGTNGKGSVSHMLAAILIKAGYKTGLYTSPHLKDFRERITINGKMISETEVTHFVENNKFEFEKIKPSFFEWTVGLAFDYFRKKNVDIAVIETGLGGRLDSTNIILPEVSVITGISLDHTNLLGDTIEKIAKEKAGIIKKNIPVVVGRTQYGIEHIFSMKAKENKSEIFVADKNYVAEWQEMNSVNKRKIKVRTKDNEFILKLDLTADYQRQNLLTVLQTVEVLRNRDFSISFKNIEEGLNTVMSLTNLRGRWEKLSDDPLTYCDVGHNEEGITEVVKMIKETPHKKLHFVLGMMKDKDHEKILNLLPLDAFYYFCEPDLPRALPAAELKEIANNYKLQGECFHSVTEAYEAAKKRAGKNDLIFVGGSTFVVAEVI